MPVLTRMTGPRGARFYDDGGTLTFVHVLDSSTRDGPRPATDADIASHPDAWEAFSAQGDAHGQFPGQPPVTFTDPPEGRPTAPQPRRRGGA